MCTHSSHLLSSITTLGTETPSYLPRTGRPPTVTLADQYNRGKGGPAFEAAPSVLQGVTLLVHPQPEVSLVLTAVPRLGSQEDGRTQELVDVAPSQAIHLRTTPAHSPQRPTRKGVGDPLLVVVDLETIREGSWS